MVDPETYRTLLSSGGGAIQPNHFDFTKWLCASGKKGQSRLRLFGTYLKVASVELDMSHHEISITFSTSKKILNSNLIRLGFHVLVCVPISLKSRPILSSG